jgi:hypothetical protein
MSVQIAKRREGEWRATVDGHLLATIRRTPFGFEITNWQNKFESTKMSQAQAVDKVREIYWSEA